MQAMVILLHSIFLFSVAYAFYQKFRDSPLRDYYGPALLLKLFAGIALGLIYKYYYQGGDTFNYFHDAVSLSNLVFRSPVTYLKALWGIYPEGWEEGLIYLQQERALLTARVLSLFTLVSHNNYWIAGMYFSLLSFLGMFYLATAITRFTRTSGLIPAVAFLFFPSVVFWSSGILKEPVAMCCLGLIIGIYIPYLLGRKKIPLWKIIISLILAWLLWEIKYYYAAVLFPLLLAGLVTTYLKDRIPLLKNSMFWQSGTVLVIFLMLMVCVSLFHPNLNISNVLHATVRNHDLYLQQASGHNMIHFKDLTPSPDSFLKNIPRAVMSGLFRPSFFDAGNLFQYMVAFENALLFLLSLLALFSLKKKQECHHTLPLLLMVMYIFLLAAILPVASPNFGTLVRHKIGFLPFFIYLVMAGTPFLASWKQRAVS